MVAQYEQSFNDITSQGWGLGRVRQQDERDREYLMRKILPPKNVPDPPINTFARMIAMKQVEYASSYPVTVATAWRNWISSSPKPATIGPSILELHQLAKKYDGLPPTVRGTTVRACARALYEEGIIGNYYWADTTSPSQAVYELRRWILHQGSPLILGCNVYTGMCEPRQQEGARTVWWADITGRLEGEAAFLIIAWSDVACPGGAARILGWSPYWGRLGKCWIPRVALARLFYEGGELCGATGKLTGYRANARKQQRAQQDRLTLDLPLEFYNPDLVKIRTLKKAISPAEAGLTNDSDISGEVVREVDPANDPANDLDDNQLYDDRE